MLLLALFALTACASDPASDVGAPSVDDAPQVTYELGAGLLITLNEAFSPQTNFEAATGDVNGACTSKRVLIQGSTTFTLFLVGASCSADPVGRGNGQEPLFASGAQLVGGKDIATEQLALGTLTMAQVDYFECTNECDFYRPTVAVLELDAPIDPDFATIVIANDYEGATRTDIRQVALALSAAS